LNSYEFLNNKAGDHVKFGFPMAYAITVLSWGVIDYEEAYVKAGELENVHKAIKWGTDYFLKVLLFY
jgi:endoglucanase